MKKVIIVMFASCLAIACSSVCNGSKPGIQGCPVYSYGYRGERCIIPQDLVEKLDKSGHKATIAVKGNQCHAHVYINQQEDGVVTPIDLNSRRY